MRWGVVVTSAAALLLAGCAVNPVTGKSQLDLLGEAQEIELGRTLYPGTIQESLGPLPDEAVQAMVRRVGQAVAAVGHRPALPYEFTAVDEPEVNAFALPGGKICITRGLLSRLESEDGVAAVLAHEVGHVTARHAVASYNRQILAGVVAVGAGIYMESSDSELRGLVGLGAVLGTQLALAFYSREQERQADALGLDYAVKAGYSPRGMIETHKVLLALQQGKVSLVERMFASHPMSAERLATAQREVEGLPPEIQARPLRVEPYRAVAAPLLAARPAWDLAAEGRRLLAAKKVREAEAKLAEAARREPRAGMIRTLHAVSLVMAERKGEAAAEAREGARLAEHAFLAQFLAGQILLDPDAAAALERLDRAESLLPGVAQVAYLRGVALERLKRPREAAQAYRTAVERDPQGQVGAAAARRLQELGYRPAEGGRP